MFAQDKRHFVVYFLVIKRLPKIEKKYLLHGAVENLHY